MRRYFNLAAISLMAIAMIAAPVNVTAQTRRSGTSSSSSARSSSGQTRQSTSSQSSQKQRSTTTTKKSTSTQSAQTRSSSTPSSQSRSTATQSSQSRSTAAQQSTATQTRQRSTATQTTRSSSQSGSGAVQRSQPANSTPARSSASGSATVRKGTTTGSGSASSSSDNTVRRRAVATVEHDKVRDLSTATRSSSQSSSSRASAAQRPAATPSAQTARNVTRSAATGSNVSRRGLTGGGAGERPVQEQPKENYRDRSGNYRYRDSDLRVDDHSNVLRVPPRDREVMRYDAPGRFWADSPHYYGYRINRLPPHYRRVTYWGIDYYLYDGIYYRLFGNVYIVCRPPFGTLIDRAIDRAILNAVTFSYYSNVYRTYSAVNDNNRTIAEQNRIIAENNATIAAQNRAMALNSDRALSAYELSDRLGLVQSYAYASSEYYYQDGVFYILDNGQYSVIIPPAGALVGSLPDDYETITLSGMEFYKVDDTVYRTTLVDGIPYLEVLGQMYGSLARQYSSL